MERVLMLPRPFLLTIGLVIFCVNLSILWFDGEDSPNTIPPVNQANLQIFYRSFLDDTLLLCNNGFLDMKNYLNPPCRAKSFALEDTTRCLDRLSYGDHSHPNQTELYQLLPTSQTPGGGRTSSENKFVHFIFVGDSTIRQHFYNLLKFLPDYDLEFDSPIGSKRGKLHMDANVTSRLLNFHASFHWEPRFSNRTNDIFSKWTSKNDVVRVIVLGMSLHHIMHLQEDSSQYSEFKRGLTELLPILQLVAKHNKVVWVKQYTVIDNPFISSIFYNHMNNLIQIRPSIYQFNLLVANILRDSGIILWNTGDLIVEGYIRSCFVLPRNDLEFTGKAYFSCPDLVHPGFVAQAYATHLFLNEACHITNGDV
ncbi:hypothetical protein OUZ56_015961 [Daphnia magna]|uniref:Lactosylceramide n=2 Tax=Daphnia magna TaxID=35525 RepID=A0ABR0APQ1_9CRUS|nr:hypothetical protein OUZ56_015961 [Daphnia magna]